MSKKIISLSKKLEKVKECQSKGHNYYQGKYIPDVIRSLEFEISTRSKHGNKAREAFLK